MKEASIVIINIPLTIFLPGGPYNLDSQRVYWAGFS